MTRANQPGCRGRCQPHPWKRSPTPILVRSFRTHRQSVPEAVPPPRRQQQRQQRSAPSRGCPDRTTFTVLTNHQALCVTDAPARSCGRCPAAWHPCTWARGPGLSRGLAECVRETSGASGWVGGARVAVRWYTTRERRGGGGKGASGGRISQSNPCSNEAAPRAHSPAGGVDHSMLKAPGSAALTAPAAALAAAPRAAAYGRLRERRRLRRE